MGKYHLKADIYAIPQKPGKYILVKAVDSKPKRKNIFVNLKLQNSNFFAVDVVEVLLKKMTYVTRNPSNSI